METHSGGNTEQGGYALKETAPLCPDKLPKSLDGRQKPSLFFCNHCKKINISEVNISPNAITWTLSALLSPCCLCFLPLFFADCNSLHHYCSVCGHPAGFTQYCSA